MYDTLVKDPKGVLSVFDHEPIPIEPGRPWRIEWVINHIYLYKYDFMSKIPIGRFLFSKI